MAKKKPTRNTTAQYKAKVPKVRYIYDAGDNRFGMSYQPKVIADEIIRVAVRLEEEGEYLDIWQVNGSWYRYYLSEFDKTDDEV